MSKSVKIPILNNEYKVIVCWGDLKHLQRTLIKHHYNPDNVTMTFLNNQVDGRRGFTMSEYRCHPVIWLNGELGAATAIGTLAHEAVHAVDCIFQAIDERTHHEEVFAHSVGAIVRETVDAMGLFKDKETKK